MPADPTQPPAAEEVAQAVDPEAASVPSSSESEPERTHVPAATPGADVESAEEVAAEAEPDYKDDYLRAMAELDNVRKRARRDVAAAEGRGVAKLARELLGPIDDLDRALAAASADDEHTKGIVLVRQQLVAALTRVGIVAESPEGDPFDPHRHEALSSMPAPEGVAAGTVVEVYQPGYVFGDQVLRAAKVVVSA